jgi:hypothetical protein
MDGCASCGRPRPTSAGFRRPNGSSDLIGMASPPRSGWRTAWALPLVAEGVETSEALEALTTAGCDFGQGYLIAPPMGPEEVVGWLDRCGPALVLPGPRLRRP